MPSLWSGGHFGLSYTNLNDSLRGKTGVKLWDRTGCRFVLG